MTTPPADRRPPLQSLDDALARLLAAVSPLGVTEDVSTFDALGRVLAADVASLIDVPPADNTAMDGYALRAADVAADVRRCRSANASPPAWSASRCSPARRRASSPARRFPPAPMRFVMQEQCEALTLDDGSCRHARQGRRWTSGQVDSPPWAKTFNAARSC